jgi:hypothetical protein
MGLWENKCLKVILVDKHSYWNKLIDAKIFNDFLHIVSIKLNSLQLKPSTREMKNRLKTIQYIQFDINIFGPEKDTEYYFRVNKYHIIRPFFKKNSNTVYFSLDICFITNAEVSIQDFYNFLYINIRKGLSTLHIQNVCSDDDVKILYNKISNIETNNKYLQKKYFDNLKKIKCYNEIEKFEDGSICFWKEELLYFLGLYEDNDGVFNGEAGTIINVFVNSEWECKKSIEESHSRHITERLNSKPKNDVRIIFDMENESMYFNTYFFLKTDNDFILVIEQKLIEMQNAIYDFLEEFEKEKLRIRS